MNNNYNRRTNHNSSRPVGSPPRGANNAPNIRPVKRAQHKKRRTNQDSLTTALIFLVAFALVLIITVICVGCSHNYTEPNNTEGNITLELSSGIIDKNAKLSTYLVGDVLYINFTELALECEMIITGSETVQTFTAKNQNGNEYIRFTSDSDTAVINDFSVQMGSKALLRESDMWISADFVSNAVNGITVKYNKETNVLTIKRNELNASTAQNPRYEEISFTHNVTNPIDTITDNGISSGTTKPDNEFEVPKYTFLADLSKYEEYMNPSNRDDYLILVNRDNMITADYVPKDLVYVYEAPSNNSKYQMVKTAAMALEALIKEAKANGLNVYARSGYRSYERQDAIFNDYLTGHMRNDGMTYEQAFAMTSTYSQIAGASEHQTGLTMDVNYTEQSFGATAEGKWLEKNCYKFGFVLRYPKEKEDITNISWEPWHLRFVGRYHAVRMHELNMCLEEYVEYLKTNR